MTICAAAICATDVTLGGPKRAVIGISDRMITAGNEIEYEPLNHTKIYVFSIRPGASAKILALGSGDSCKNFSVSKATQGEMEKLQTTEVEKAAELYADSLVSFRNNRTERLHLSPFDLTLKSFIDRQQDLAPDIANDLAKKIMSEITGVSTIITGIDPNGDPRIFSVGGIDEYGQEDLHPICHDQTGFLAVGSGANQFESLFMFSGYDTTWRLPDALFLMYCAKKRAEVSPGVGKYTDMFIIDVDGFRLISKEATKAFEEHYDVLEKSIQEERQQAINRIIGDKRIFSRSSGPGHSQLNLMGWHDSVGAEKEEVEW